MKNLQISGFRDVYFFPTVNFNSETGICELSGESFLENTKEFYKPILNWIERYISDIKKPITFIVKLTYFNTSSSKSILAILKLLSNYQKDDGEVNVIWYYDDEDSDIEEFIEDFMDDFGLTIDLRPFED